jgi:predicted  nucleic acid-binding Zn-ribbon protein
MNKLMMTAALTVVLSAPAFASADRPDNYIYTDQNGVMTVIDQGGENYDAGTQPVLTYDFATQAELDALSQEVVEVDREDMRTVSGDVDGGTLTLRVEDMEPSRGRTETFGRDVEIDVSSLDQSTEVNNLDARMGAVEGRTGSLENRMDFAESQNNTQNSRLAGVEGRLGDVEGRVTTVEGDVVDLADELDRQVEYLHDVDGRIVDGRVDGDTLVLTTGADERRTGDQYPRHDTAFIDISELATDADVDAVADDVDALRTRGIAERDRLDGRIDSTESDIDRLQTRTSNQADRLNRQGDRLDQQAGRLNNQSDRIRNLRGDMQTQVGRLDGRVDAVDGRLTGEANRLDGRVDAVEGQVGRVERESIDRDNQLSAAIDVNASDIDAVDGRVTAEAGRLDGRVDDLANFVDADQQRQDDERARVEQESMDRDALVRARVEEVNRQSYARDFDLNQSINQNIANINNNTNAILLNEWRIDGLERNVQQNTNRIIALENGLDQLARETNSGLAGVAAMTSIPGSMPGQTIIGFGYGHWEGEDALAMGIERRSEDGRSAVSLKATLTSKSSGIAVGYSWAF